MACVLLLVSGRVLPMAIQAESCSADRGLEKADWLLEFCLHCHQRESWPCRCTALCRVSSVVSVVDVLFILFQEATRSFVSLLVLS